MPILQILITLAIIASLSCLSIAHYQDWREKKSLYQALTIMSNAISLARTLNITRDRPIYLCASQDEMHCNPSWLGDVTLFTSAHPPTIEVILDSTALPNHITMQSHNFNNNLYLRFMNTGEMVYNGSFTLQSTHQALCFSLSKTGLAKEIPCQNQAAAG